MSYTFTKGKYHAFVKTKFGIANNTDQYGISNVVEFDVNPEMVDLHGLFNQENKVLYLNWSTLNKSTWQSDEVIIYKYNESLGEWVEDVTLSDSTMEERNRYKYDPLTIGSEGSL